MNDRQYEVMKKYYNSKDIYYQDRVLIDELVSQGIMTTCIRKEIVPQDGMRRVPTAFLTDMGKGLYKRERIRKSPLLRWLSTPNV